MSEPYASQDSIILILKTFEELGRRMDDMSERLARIELGIPDTINAREEVKTLARELGKLKKRFGAGTARGKPTQRLEALEEQNATLCFRVAQLILEVTELKAQK